MKSFSKEDFVACLPMEIKARELDGRLYVAARMLARGMGVLFGDKAGVHKSMMKLGARPIYFDKGMHPPHFKFYRQLKACGGMLVGLDEEGGMLTAGGDSEGQLVSRHPDCLLKHCELVCAWGNPHRNAILRNRRAIAPENVVATGHPKFDLCRKEFEPYFRKISGDAFKIGVPPESPTILVNTNFNYANNWVEVGELASRYPVRGASFTRAYFYKRREYQKVVLSSMVSMVKYLAKALPEVKILVRPHPTERHDIYLDALQEFRNVGVGCQGSVHEAISVATILIHHDCTTGIEGTIHGMPVISYQPVFDVRYAQQFPAELGVKATEASEVLEIVSQVLDRNSTMSIPSGESISKASAMFPNLDFDAGTRIADEVVKRRDQVPSSLHVWPNAYWEGREMAGRLVSRLRYVANPDAGKSVVTSQEQKFSGLKREDVELRLRLFRECGVEFPEVEIEQLDINTFALLTR